MKKNLIILLLILCFTNILNAKTVKSSKKVEKKEKVFKEDKYDKTMLLGSFGLENTKKNPYGSSILSMYFPGLGQMYNADFKKSLCFIAGFVVSHPYRTQLKVISVLDAAISSILRTRKIKKLKKKNAKKQK